MSTVIAVCHQKGGVGKTTTTLALGGCFAEQGCRSLVIDLDPQANLTNNLGLETGSSRYAIAEVIAGEATPTQAAVTTSLPGLDIIPSNGTELGLDRRLFQVPGHEFRLRRSLGEDALSEYAVVLVDCPPSVGPLTVNALTAADLMIIPTQCEYYSIQALKDLFELVNIIRSRTNPALIFRILVTMHDRRGTFHSIMLEQLRECFGEGLFTTVIGFDTKIREAQAFGLPITVHAPKSRGAIQYRKLAEEISPYVTKKPLTPTG